MMDIIEKEIKAEEMPEHSGKRITPKAKNAIIWFVVINVILLGIILVLYSNNQPNPDLNNTQTNYSSEDVILFFSPTCPHCKNVEDFIQNNSLDSKLNITRKNVWNSEVVKEYNTLADKCNIPASDRGVPMMYYNNNCSLGDVPSIEILKKAGGII